jgi:YegS/Rv2252/BmrU family lipid kinase
MVKVAFIINGLRKLKKENQELIHHCVNHNALLVEQKVTEHSGHATELAKEYTKSKTHIIIAVGGDGTANEVINGIMYFSTDERPIFYVLANGTANDFVRGELQYFTINNFLQSLCAQKNKSIDIGLVSINEKSNYFLNIADAGIGGKVVQILDSQRKYFGGKFSYFSAILRGFLWYKKPNVSIKMNDIEMNGPLLMMAVCNGKMFGDGLIIAPEAKIDDGVLNVSLFSKVSIIDYLRNLSRLKSGIKLVHEEVSYFKCQKVELKVKEGELFTETDGELFESGDVTFEIIPKAIRLLKV